MIKYLEKLLNGREVEWKKLVDVCEIKRERVLSKKYLEDNKGQYSVYSSQIVNNGEIGKINSYDYDGEYLTWTTDGAYAGTVFYRNEKFSITNMCGLIYVKDKRILNIKFLFYCIQISAKNYVTDGSGNPKLISNVVEKIDIPIPPLDIQEEIVRVLDKLTDLTKELTLRKKEYSYYRDYLLEFKNIDDLGIEVKKVELLDVCLYSNEKIESSLLNLYNYISIENMLQNCKGVIPSSNVPDKGKWTKYAEGDILIGNIRPYLKKIWLADKEGGNNGDVLVLKKNSDKINMKYLYFVLSDDNFFNYVKNNIKSGKMSRGDKERILKYNFFLPSLKIQERIVNVLDNFEKMCNDLNIGLPKEIELRTKQYEYYREQLLTFDK